MKKLITKQRTTEQKIMPYPTYEERVAFGQLPKEQRQELFEKMTPEERSNISGYGTEDDPGYCDMNGHCYSYEDDADVADSYIKEIKKLREQVEQEKSKNSDLLSFIGGNFDYEDNVKEQIKEFYSEEFIKSNEEQWSQVCIDWD